MLDVALALSTIAAVAAPAAPAARAPRPSERAVIGAAVVAAGEAAQASAVPSFAGRVTQIRVSAVTTPSAFFTRYASADVYDPAIGGAVFFLGFRHGFWHVLNYGSSDVGCGFPQRLLGGKRAAILNDLGLTCSP